MPLWSVARSEDSGGGLISPQPRLPPSPLHPPLPLLRMKHSFCRTNTSSSLGPGESRRRHTHPCCGFRSVGLGARRGFPVCFSSHVQFSASVIRAPLLPRCALRRPTHTGGSHRQGHGVRPSRQSRPAECSWPRAAGGHRPRGSATGASAAQSSCGTKPALGGSERSGGLGLRPRGQ